ncbi:MAG: T9SS type A sorting domain-containing protein [Bacteroidetes bacterium]|nr:T9SS type A sorting domain-containing protein [Bacteroidota bacterium]
MKNLISNTFRIIDLKMHLKISIFTILFLNLNLSSVIPQELNVNFNATNLFCGMNEELTSIGQCDSSYSLPFFPIDEDTLRALVVFCNFAADSGGSFDISGSSLLQYWPGSQAEVKPTWADSIICPTTTNVWDRSLTGYFRDASQGKFWLIGDVYPDLYIFQRSIAYYANSSRGIGFAVKELLENINSNVNYSNYDKFDPYDFNHNDNRREPDGIVDFIFINFRFTNAHTIDLGSYTGIALLGGLRSNFGSGVSEITLDGKRIFACFPGSGCIYEMQNPWTLGIPIHEFAEHYSYGGGHSENMGSFNINGGGLPSAYDREYLNWNSSGSSPTSNLSTTLGDYVTTGDYIKIERTNDVIYLENRRRLSYYASNNFRGWKWLSSDPRYPIMPDSGLLIYRNTGFRSFEIESANGHWNWAKCGGGQYKVNYASPTFNIFAHSTLNRFAGESTFDLRLKSALTPDCQTIVSPVFGTTSTVTYMGVNGDSNTCFDVDYNQVYSPWSNPPLPVSNTNDSLTIEISGRNSNGSLSLQIYFTNILGASPSKPQGLVSAQSTIDPYLFNPKITWNRNLEPDHFKYFIYRTDANPTTGEEYYSYTLIDSTSDTSYIDLSLTLYASGGGSGPCAYYALGYAYKVSSIDNTRKESVKSVRTNIVGYSDPCAPIGPMPYSNSNTKNNSELGLSHEINQYQLYDNFPNPFNPTTIIKFDLPEQTFVNLNVYDVTGKQVIQLVSEYKDKGQYSIEFNASNLPSGVYYYKIQTGSYSNVRKMLLLK